eukprot:UN33098
MSAEDGGEKIVLIEKEGGCRELRSQTSLRSGNHKLKKSRTNKSLLPEIITPEEFPQFSFPQFWEETPGGTEGESSHYIEFEPSTNNFTTTKKDNSPRPVYYYEVQIKTFLRCSESPKSNVISILEPGTKVQIDITKPDCAHIILPVQGWVSLRDKDDKSILKLDDDTL